MSFKSLVSDEDDTDNLYYILGVSQNASESEIRAAYKRLSMSFHPDKNPGNLDLTSSLFQRINRAYSVLIDPNKRFLYDQLGEQGLDTKIPTTIGPRNMTQEELRAEILKNVKSWKLLQLENLTLSKSSIEIPISLESLFSGYKVVPLIRFPVVRELDWNGRLGNCGVKGIALLHSFSVPLRNDLRVKLSGKTGIDVDSKVMGTALWMSKWGEVRVAHSLYAKRTTTAKFTKTLSKLTFLRLEGRYSHDFNKLSGRCTIVHELPTKTTFTASFSQQSSLLCLSPPGSDPQGMIYTLTSLNQHLLFSPAYHTRLGNGYSLITGISVHLGNPVEFTDIFCEVEKIVSEGVKIGCRVSSTRWRITWDYHGQKVFIPVILGEEVNSNIIFYGIIIPALTLLGVELTLLRSRRERLRKEKIINERKLWSEQLKEKRQQALEIQALFRDQTTHKQFLEKKKGGLFIQSAYYGSTEEMVDVTLPVAAMVNESQLVLPFGVPKWTIPGVWNPAYGAPKKMVLRYLFNGRSHFVEIRDREGIICPLRGSPSV